MRNVNRITGRTDRGMKEIWTDKNMATDPVGT
jgi:hypothetical protein